MVARKFKLLSADEAVRVRRSGLVVLFPMGIAGFIPVIVVVTELAHLFAPILRVPNFSDLILPFPEISAGAAVIGTLLLGFMVNSFGRLLLSPIVEIEVDDAGLVFTNLAGSSSRVSWSSPGLHLQVDAFPQTVAEPNPDGYHWGVARFVRGYKGGWCQVDEVVLHAILRSAEAAQIMIERETRRTFEGPAQRMLLRAGAM